MPLKDRAKVISTWLVAVVLVAYWVAEAWFTLRFWIVLMAVGALSGGAIGFIWWRWSRSLRLEAARFDGQISRLSLEDARLRAHQLMVDPNRFTTTPRMAPLPEVDLPRSVLDIFTEVETIRDVTGNTLRLGHSSVDFVQVGDLHDGVKLLARASDGAIFEVWPDQPGPTGDPDYPSLQHWIVFNEEQERARAEE
jgi:hypothetical protein